MNTTLLTARGAGIELVGDRLTQLVSLWLNSRGVVTAADLSPDEARELARRLVDFADRVEGR